MSAERGLPQDGNRIAGFWESQALREIHDELLAAAGTSWDDPVEFPNHWLGTPQCERFIDKLVACFENEFGEKALVVVKDPRLCRLVPVWLRVLERTGALPACIIPLRNPLEVAASLKRRDSFPTPKGLLLWLHHFLAAERDSREVGRCFVTYPSLLEDWRTVVAGIVEYHGLDLPRRSLRQEARIESFLDSRLRHHKTWTDQLEQRSDVSEWISTAYSWALEACEKPDLDPAPLDQIREALQAAESTFGPLVEILEESLASASAVASAGDGGRVDHAQSASGETPDAERAANAGVVDHETSSYFRRDNLLRMEKEVVQLCNRERSLQAELDAMRAEMVLRDTRLIDLGKRLKNVESMRNRMDSNGVRAAEARDDRRRLQRQLQEMRGSLADLEQRLDEIGSELQECSGRRKQELERRLQRNEDDTQDELRAMRKQLERDRQVVLAGLSRQQQLLHYRTMTHGLGGRPIGARRPFLRRIEYTRLMLVLKAPLWMLGFRFKRRLKLWLEARCIWRSGLFSEGYYLSTYPDVGMGSFDALYHFVKDGAAEGRNPNPFFDTEFYVARHADVSHSAINPLIHYILCGAAEGRSTSQDFDTAYYVSQNPDVGATGLNPLRHYLEIGIWQGRGATARG